MKTVQPNPHHVAMRDAVIAAMRPFDFLPAIEMLAVMSYTVGQLIALQDQTTYTAAAAMEVVSQNIELGNAQAITAAGLGKLKP